VTEGRRFVLYLLLVGVAVRALTAILYLDVVWADEHYQTLEPAGRLVFDFGWKSWEWYAGARSWIVPALYVPVLFVCKAVGLNGGPGCIIACRLLMVALSGVMLWRFHRLLAESQQNPLSRHVALAAFALAPAMIAWGPTTLSDTWALCALWIPMPTLVRVAEKTRRRDFVFAGVLLGLSFLARFQMVIWAVGFGAVLLARRGTRRIVPYLAFGYLGPVLFYGLVDWATWGEPFHSLITNFRMNLFAGVAASMGQSPWYDYLPRIAQNLGPVVLILLLLPVVVAIVAGRLRIDLRGALVLVPAALTLAAHMAIPHKETRFVLPIYPALFYLFGAALHGLTASRPIGASPARGAVAWLAVPALAAVSFPFVHSSAHYERSDVSELGRAIRADGALQKDPGACVLFVDHYWVWLRGELLQGHKVAFVEVPAQRLLSDPSVQRHLQRCAYAVLPGEREELFRAGAGPSWGRLAKSAFGHVLYKNGRVNAALVAPPAARDVPVREVPAAVLVELYENALAKDPQNRLFRRKYADLCRERRLPCAKAQYGKLLEQDPNDAEVRRILEEMEKAP
jgi:hypothetical protein